MECYLSQFMEISQVSIQEDISNRVSRKELYVCKYEGSELTGQEIMTAEGSHVVRSKSQHS